MDLTHSTDLTVTSESYIPGSKSTDFIKPKDSSNNLEAQNQVLAIFTLYSASNALQWIQYSIIANVVERLSPHVVLYFLYTAQEHRCQGLRVTALCGAIGTCAGACVKVFSVHPDLFYVGFIGQSIVATSQVFILSLPARVAAVWFGPDQVSSACSIGVFGNQLGVALGFLLPPLIVRNHDYLEFVERDLQLMFYLIAGFTSVLVVLVFFFFQAQPPTPPSAAQEATQSPIESSRFLHSIKRLFFNMNYIALLISYGMNVGVFYAISTLLNRIVLLYYPGHEMDAGRIGLCIVLAGMLGSVCCGIVLDKTHRFKETTLAVYAFSMIGMWIYTFTLNVGHIAVVYVTSALLGFFMTGYLPVGFEFAAELTYPEPEGTSAGLLNAAAQIFGIFFTMLYAEIFDTFGDTHANITMAIMLCTGTIVTAVIKSDLRRQAASQTTKN